MRKYSNNLFLLLLLFFLIESCTKPMSIESFSIANINKTNEDGTQNITQEYLIKNWKNTKENEMKIDSFVCNRLRPDYLTIHSYFLCFYNYTDKVNPSYYAEMKKLCELEMADEAIICYTFSNGLFSKMKGNNKTYLKPLTNFKCVR